MAILGLSSSATSAAYISEKTRRRVLHQYPQGKAPLMYILSLMEDMETDKSEFGVGWEDRDTCIVTPTVTAGTLGGGGAGPFTDASLTVSQAAAGFTTVAGTEYGLKVVDASVFREYDVIWVRQVPNGAASAFLDVRGTVTYVNTTTNFIKFRAAAVYTSISNDTDANAISVFFTSSSAPEGARSVDGAVTFPIEPTFYTQIFRNTIGPFTRTALKQGLRFDSSGPYKEAAHKTAIRHMKGLELAALRGRRTSGTTTNQDGSTVPVKTTGGIEQYLEYWERGTVANGSIVEYRPGGTDVSSSAWQTTDEKRIIPVNGAITRKQFEMLIERAFRYTNDSTFEKLVLCGNGFMTQFQEMVKLCSYRVTELDASQDTFGMDMMKWRSPWGTLLFKTHPLLNENIAFSYDAYILDTCNLKYAYLSDSDTQILKNRQSNDFDGRKDEILTEAGFAISFPESHMYIKGLTDVTR